MNDEYTVLLDNATGRAILVYADEVYEDEDCEVRFFNKKELVAVFNMKSIIGWYKGN